MNQPAVDLFQKYNVAKMPLHRVPFGLDENGQKVVDVGRSVHASVGYLQELVRRATYDSLPDTIPVEDRKHQSEAAARAALVDLAEMLNQSARDQRHHVTSDYLEDPGNFFSYEYNLIVNVYARAISGDPGYYFDRGATSIPQSMVWLTRPLSVARRYETVAALAARFIKTDIKCLDSSKGRAVMQWDAAFELQFVPEAYRDVHIEHGCDSWKGLTAAVPEMAGLPRATIIELECDIPTACRWECRWQEPQAGRRVGVWIGAGVALLALLAWLLKVPFPRWTGLLLIPLPLIIGWLSSQLGHATRQQGEQRDLLMEQQRESDKQHIQLQTTFQELQVSHFEVLRKVDELTALHEVSLIISASRDLDDLLEQVVTLVRSRLQFDRAMTMLVDEEQQALVVGSTSGGTDEMEAALEGFTIPAGATHIPIVKALREGRPVLVSAEEAPPELASIIQALGTRSFLSVPLEASGKAVGALVVDNATTDRPITQADQDVLMTLGRAVAVAIDNLRLYQEVQEHSLTLEQRVEERSQQLREANEELLRQREAADHANQLKSQFLANMSHELRTPLNSIIGYTDLVIQGVYGPINDGQEDRLERVQRNGRNLLLLINDVLDLSKIEADRMELMLSTVDPARLIDVAVTTLQPQASDGNIYLKTDMEGKLPHITADETRILQILNNLLSNAVKFTREGGVTVRARHEQADRLIVIDVIDTGIGIPADQLDNIFTEFQQVDGSTTREFGGTGLGLTITRKLAQLHGGDITVRSKLGQGSTFTLTLPVEAMAQPVAPLPVSPVRSVGGADRPLVLVIDDQQEAVDIIQSQLLPANYRIEIALTGEDGLQLARELKPDAITLDLLMPEMDGWTVLSRLRGSPDTAGIPVVIVSIVDSRPLALELGAFEFLSKPVDRERLLGAIRRAVAGPPTHPVLVVDDNPDDRDLMSTILSGAGYAVSVAPGGQEAMDWLDANTARLIVLDLMMPQVSGFDVLAFVRARYPETPVLVVTAKMLTADEEKFLSERLVDVVRKQGLVKDQLLGEVERALGRKTA